MATHFLGATVLTQLWNQAWNAEPQQSPAGTQAQQLHFQLKGWDYQEKSITGSSPKVETTPAVGHWQVRVGADGPCVTALLLPASAQPAWSASAESRCSRCCYCATAELLRCCTWQEPTASPKYHQGHNPKFRLHREQDNKLRGLF